jgi:hypothetical protein
MLCDKCHLREARVHYTVCASHAVEAQKHFDLCQECFEASDLDWARELPDAIQPVCQYCGGETHYASGFDSLALPGGGSKMGFKCKACEQEYYAFLKPMLPSFGDWDLTDEQLAKSVAEFKSSDYPAILAKLDEHMKQWVAKRKSS